MSSRMVRRLVRAICGIMPAANAGLFDAFPLVDDAQHAVYDAEVLQLVGTVDAALLQKALHSAHDRLWKPLLVSQPTEDAAPRAIFSVGVGDFKNTSAGHYRELAVAFPACEVDTALQLNCRTFMECQAKLPDCSHTYMFRSYVNREAALWRARETGIDARLASSFRIQLEEDDASDGMSFGRKVLRATVLGPGGEEVVHAAVELAQALPSGPDPRGEPESPGDVEHPKLAKDGFQVYPYVGAPGILGTSTDGILGASPLQARHMVAFPGNVDVRPARLAEPAQVGSFLEDLQFELEAALHLPHFSLMQLPTWGHRKGVRNSKSASVSGGSYRMAGASDAVAAKAASDTKPTWGGNMLEQTFVVDDGTQDTQPTWGGRMGKARMGQAAASALAEHVTTAETSLTNKQATLTGTEDVPNLDTALAGKQETLTHPGDVPGMTAVVSGKQNVLTQPSDVPGLTDALVAKQLVGDLIPASNYIGQIANGTGSQNLTERTTALAMDKQDLITDGELTIARTALLQSMLDGKVAAEEKSKGSATSSETEASEVFTESTGFAYHLGKFAESSSPAGASAVGVASVTRPRSSAASSIQWNGREL